MQLAVAAGANVVSTTSSTVEAEKLKALGATHMLNYRKDATWGQSARALTPEGEGFDFVVEVGGERTLKQSLSAVKMEGIMAVVGIVGGGSEAAEGAAKEGNVPSLLAAWLSTIIVCGIAVGSRTQLEEMNAFIEAKGLKPVVDERVFALRETREAYRYLREQRQFGKGAVDCKVE